MKKSEKQKLDLNKAINLHRQKRYAESCAAFTKLVEELLCPHSEQQAKED